MNARLSADDFFACSAYFPKRVFVFGEFHEGYTCDRWIARYRVGEMLEYARKVSEAGGLFYLDGRKHRYVALPIEFMGASYPGRILMDGWTYNAPGTLPPAPNACRRTAEVAPATAADFTCLVTRKVSATRDSDGGKRGA